MTYIPDIKKQPSDIAEKNNEEGNKMFKELNDEYSEVLAGVKQLESNVKEYLQA